MPPELRRDAARNRELLLDAARRRLDTGDAELRMNALAADAGVGVGTAYRHFPDRQTLLAALAAPGVLALAGRIHEAKDGDDPLAAIGAVMRHVMLAQLDDRAVAEVLRDGPGTDPQVADTLARMTRDVQDLLDRAHARGEVAAVQPDDLRRLLCGLDHAARLGTDPTRDAGAYVDLVLAGLRTR
ncbi:TetR/AcrR family transcriptional regulator [Cellulomonas fimi]|uniref:TetR/AcrR family transcriptional regulator n=1 Tax=Cellulomonas fimi TaxID=1708 RepID=UPI00234DDA3E|nr:TetR/AcrR family transcriptional regulator [Cellulomonas fimi]MDC7122670.1 TetR/AcrR family transcriptional regulator [Cellulomonas fimi]